MKILIDMNLTPAWVQVLEKHGWESVHWSEVGEPRATDHDIMQWARINGFVVFTHDLDFSAILAATQAEGPSVIQVRGQDVLPTHMESIMVSALRQFEPLLQTGAIIVVDERKAKARVLPINK